MEQDLNLSHLNFGVWVLNYCDLNHYSLKLEDPDFKVSQLPPPTQP